MPEDARVPSRPFWSGTITFGLVSVPVDLYPANRSGGVRLRLLAPDGTPLRRRYVCPRHEEPVPPEHIVRGRERDGEWIVVADEELDALDPKKSREIDLRRFVAREEIDPAHFERGYLLAPASESTKAYRLLAGAMQEAGRAGIATFVMRGREYLAAILAEGGLLRVATLRWSDELRSPEDVGLPDASDPDPGAMKAIRAAIRANRAAELPVNELMDERSEGLRALADRKKNDDRDVVPASEVRRADETEVGEVEVIDLVEVIRRRLEKDGEEAEDAVPLGELTKDELYERAKELDIPGRSRMTKDELLSALRRKRG